MLDPSRHRLLIFSGDASASLTNDTWAYDLSGSTGWSAVSPAGPLPGARFEAAAIYDPARDRLVVMGGATSGDYYGIATDVWALSLSTTTWSEPAPGGIVAVSSRGARCDL